MTTTDISSPVSHPATAEERVAVSIQPVIVYSSELNEQSANSSEAQVQPQRPWLREFERESKLLDISPSGEPSFEKPPPSSLELQSKVQRLWIERGDFSKFSIATLLGQRAHADKRAESEHAGSKPQSADDRSSRSPSYERDAPSYLTPLAGIAEAQSETAKGGQTRAEAPAFVSKPDPNEFAGAQRSGESQIRGKFIDENIFNPLWAEMLGRLDHAHVTAIHSHQLIGMLLKAYKLPSSSTGGLSAARSSSPVPSALSASVTAQIRPAGDDFVLDPLSIGVSRIKVAVPERPQDAEDEEPEDDVDEDERAVKSAVRDASSNEAQRIFDRKVCLSQKRASLLSAAAILRTGASELRTSQGPERERWRGLRELKQRGWGLTPGRPLNDQYGAASAEDEDPLPGLRGFGTTIVSQGKIKDEGARDAWIGFGMPEASLQQRRRTLAYWTDAQEHEVKGQSAKPGPDDAASRTRDRLVFPYRPKKRLRVRFVHTETSDDFTQAGATSDETGSNALRTAWTSDDNPSDFSPQPESPPATLGELLETELQSAQQEFADEEAFRDIVHQCRSLDPAFDVRLSPESVSLEVTPHLDLIFELIDTEPDSDGNAGRSHGPEAEEAGAAKSLADAHRHSPFATLVLAYARFAPLRKHLGRQEAALDSRSGDIYAKAQALRAQTLAVPRGRSSSASKMPRSEANERSNRQAARVPDSVEIAATSIYKKNILGPIFSVIHYSSFVYRLGLVLSSCVSRFNAGRPARGASKATYTLSGVTSIESSLQEWLATLVERGTSWQTRSDFRPDLLFQLSSGNGQPDWTAGIGCGETAQAASGNGDAGKGSSSIASAHEGELQGGADLGLSGHARVFVSQSCVAVVTISLPSSLVVHFPLKQTPQGRGLSLSLDLATFEQLLEREMQRAL